MRIIPVVAALVVVAGCSAKASPPASVAAVQLQSSSPTPPAPSSATPDAATVASCSQFDAGMAAAFGDVTLMQGGDITSTVVMIGRDMRASESLVKTAAGNAPGALASHESAVAKSLDMLAVKVLGTSSGTLAIATEVAAVRDAEGVVGRDCLAAGYTLKNMIAS